MSETDSSGAVTPPKSAQGYAVFMRNLHEETTVDDVYDLLSDSTDVLDVAVGRISARRKYAVVTFASRDGGDAMLAAIPSRRCLGLEVEADWAFRSTSSQPSSRVH
eukprot:c10242_g1_i2.p1 GENE.c10242_g1_i2~~c10242_g1_i2.p1  ORF type:complete len:106 (-),score=11.79 c10242_g1_i2:509-826(-)